MSKEYSSKLVEAMCDFINDNGVECIYGANAFEDFKPDGVDSIIAILEYAGLTNRHEPVELRSFQILVRDKSNQKAKERAREIYKIFINKEKINELSNGSWASFHVRSTPEKLKIDVKRRHEYVFNVGVMTPVED